MDGRDPTPLAPGIAGMPGRGALWGIPGGMPVEGMPGGGMPGGIEGIIAFGNTARPADFGALAPRIVTSDDPAASRIFGAAIARIREILTTLQAGDSLPVVFLGGLGPHYAARLGDPWPVKAAIGNSLDGAVLMARQMAGAA